MKVYLDNNASTQAAPEVIEAMLPYFREFYQNPSSVSGEALGLREVVGRSRMALAALLNVPDPATIAFTSGATESNNWAILGVPEAVAVPGHLITSAIEHPSVLEPMRYLESRGWELTILRVGPQGTIDADELFAALRDNTSLVSIMTANNETGVVQPISALASIVKERTPSAIFHTDATQAIGKVSVSLSHSRT